MAMFKKPIFWLILILILIWSTVFSLPDNRLHLVFCDVGEGDAALISYRSTQILIDGGPDNKVLTCLAKNMPFWDRTIEMVILSHPQTDHFMGLIDVLQRYNVKQFVEELTRGDKVRMGPVEFLVLWPKEVRDKTRAPLFSETRAGVNEKSEFNPLSLSEPPIRNLNEKSNLNLTAAQYSSKRMPSSSPSARSANLNETSLVLRLSFGNFCALFTGDVPAKIDVQIEGAENCQILKVAHHGSKYATSKTFLQQVKPQLAVISVGKNRYGHPTEETLGRLEKIGARILRTDKNGEIKVVSDGQKFMIQ